MTDPQPNGQLLSAEAVARKLCVARAFVYRHAAELGAFKVGSHLRFLEGEVDEWLSRQRLVKPERQPSPAELLARRVRSRSGVSRRR